MTLRKLEQLKDLSLVFDGDFEMKFIDAIRFGKQSPFDEEIVGESWDHLNDKSYHKETRATFASVVVKQENI